MMTQQQENNRRIYKILLFFSHLKQSYYYRRMYVICIYKCLCMYIGVDVSLCLSVCVFQVFVNFVNLMLLVVVCDKDLNVSVFVSANV